MGLSNLPPGVTNSDIENQVGVDGVLSDESEAFLSSQELYSLPTRLAAELADIFTVDGDRLFTVSKSISAYDLRAMYFNGRREFDRGVLAGREALAASLRNLIGAADKEIAF